MNCKKIRKKISNYIDKNLSEKDRIYLENHLNKCVQCKNIYEQTVEAIEFVSKFEAEKLPKDFYSKLRPHLEVLQNNSKLNYFTSINLFKGFAAVLGLILIIYIIKEIRFNSVGEMQSTRAVENNSLENRVSLTEKNKIEEKPLVTEKKVAKYIPRKEIEKNIEAIKIIEDEKKLRADLNFNSDKRDIIMYRSYDAISNEPNRFTKEIILQQDYQLDSKEWIGFFSDIKESKNVVIKDIKSLQEIWTKLEKSEGAKPLPNIDFSKEMIIGVFMGEKELSGYGVKIIAVENKSNKIVVYYKEVIQSEESKKNSIGLNTQPYHLKTVPKTDLPVIFKKLK